MNKHYWNLSLYFGIFFSIGMTFCEIFRHLLFDKSCYLYSNNILEIFFIILIQLLFAILFGPIVVKLIVHYTPCKDSIILYYEARYNVGLFRNYYRALILYDQFLKNVQSNDKLSSEMLSYIRDAHYAMFYCYYKLEDYRNAKSYLLKYLAYIEPQQYSYAKDKICSYYNIDSETFEFYPPKDNFIKNSVVLILLTAIFMLFICILFRKSNDLSSRVLIETNNLSNASEIQEFLLTPTVLEYDKTHYTIKPLNVSKDNKYAHLIWLLVDSHLLDNNTNIVINNLDLSNLKKLENTYTKLIQYMALVKKCKVTIVKLEDSNQLGAKIEVSVSKNTDIKRLTQNIKDILIFTSNRTIKEENIDVKCYIINKIDFYNMHSIVTENYYNLASRAYLNNDYGRSIKYLKECQNRDKEYCSISIKSLDEIIKLNSKIDKNPNNYQYYIQRADIKAIPLVSMFKSTSSITNDYEGAIKDYKKALQLNPKNYSIYEKLGDVYVKMSLESKSDEQLLQNALAYYEKAFEYDKTQDITKKIQYVKDKNFHELSKMLIYVYKEIPLLTRKV